jgi:hypothetical protein
VVALVVGRLANDGRTAPVGGYFRIAGPRVAGDFREEIVMKCIAIAFQLAAVFVGFASAWYWWRSANTGPVEIPATDKPKGHHGDQLLDWGGDKMMYVRNYEQSKLNAKAARWTAVSVLLQLMAIISGTMWPA